MPTREDVVKQAAEFNGLYNGDGYDCSNRFSTDMGRTREAWCVDFVDDVCRLVGAPLHIDTASVATLWGYAGDHDARKHSWNAQPGDLMIFHWPGGNPDGDHVEMVVYWHNGVARTIGGNSHGSNVDGFKGTGGVHLHDWSDPEGKGPTDMLGAIDLAKICDLSKTKKPAPPPASESPRRLQLKSPYLKGADVKELQHKLNKHLAHGEPEIIIDGVFGPTTEKALRAYQHSVQDPFGVAAAHTRHDLGIH